MSRRESRRRVSDEMLLEDLQRLEAVLRRAPRTKDIRDHGKHSVTTYRDRFDSHFEALDMAGIPLDPIQEAARERHELLEEARR